MTNGAVLVTGAHGFVGRHLIARGREQGVPMVEVHGDLLDASVATRAVREHRPAAVVHLAAARATSDAGRWDVLARNQAMAGNVLTAAAESAPGAPVLIPGSAAQYGFGAPYPLSESAPTVAVSHYGAMKCVLETAALSPPLRGAVRVIWTRTFNHLGPGQGPSAPVANWARQLAEAERSGSGTVFTGRLDVLRDFLDVRDVADAYLELVRSDADGAINVCSGTGTRLRELVHELIELSSAHVGVELDPALERSVDPPAVVGDPDKLRRTIRWAPRIDLRSSLRDVLAEWRSRAGLA